MQRSSLASPAHPGDRSRSEKFNHNLRKCYDFTAKQRLKRRGHLQRPAMPEPAAVAGERRQHEGHVASETHQASALKWRECNSRVFSSDMQRTRCCIQLNALRFWMSKVEGRGTSQQHMVNAGANGKNGVLHKRHNVSWRKMDSETPSQ